VPRIPSCQPISSLWLVRCATGQMRLSPNSSRKVHGEYRPENESVATPTQHFHELHGPPEWGVVDIVVEPARAVI
jgi:hypothetical protein